MCFVERCNLDQGLMRVGLIFEDSPSFNSDDIYLGKQTRLRICVRVALTLFQRSHLAAFTSPGLMCIWQFMNRNLMCAG